MTRTIAVDENNDIAVLGGNIVLAKDLQAIMMLCKHAALTMRGEMFLAIDEGLPNFELLWNGSPRLRLWENELRLAFMAIEDVLAVEKIDIQLKDKNIAYTATIRTVYGISNVEDFINGL